VNTQQKIESILLIRIANGMYRQKESIIKGNNYLSMLIDVFNEDYNWTEVVKEELLDPSSRGISGNKCDIIIKSNKVIIEPQFVDNPEDYAIDIDRDVLLSIIDTWEKLNAKQCQEITFTRHVNGTITLAGE